MTRISKKQFRELTGEEPEDVLGNDWKNEAEDIEEVTEEVIVTRYQTYKEFLKRDPTNGQAYNFAHSLWDENNPEDMKDLAAAHDENLSFLFFH